jgi:mannose PTS system EIIA component
MSIIIARIDDRLIHGQVTEGWAKHYTPDLIVVVSDLVASADWQSELCLAALPNCFHGLVVGIKDAPRLLNELENDVRRVFVLFESPRDAYEVIRDGAPIKNLNVGGMHSIKGKREILDYLYIDDNDAHFLRELSVMGVALDFRDLPEHANIDVLSKL